MNLDRYQRQMLLPEIGEAGQRHLLQSRVLLIGCGALGSVIAEQIVRAGVGTTRIADRDIVESSNLSRQFLYNEHDARQNLPKAIAASRRLAMVNSEVSIEPHVVDVDAENIAQLSHGCDLILDGTDNVETRYLINDLSLRDQIPWIYGACVGTVGRVMTIRPDHTPCLRCIYPEPPAPGELPTCDTAGVLGPIAGVVGSMQALAAIKFLSGHAEAIGQHLLMIDLWNNRIRAIDLREAKRADCPTCARREFSFLDSKSKEMTARLCGRNAVQVRPPGNAISMSLDAVAQKLKSVGAVSASPFLVRCELPDAIRLAVFSDGRMIVHGTDDPARARSIYARYLGA